MKIDILIKHLTLDDGVLDKIRERFEHSLDHFEQHILSGHAVLSDVNGPRGGADKHCMVQLRLRGGVEIVVEEEGVELLTVAGGAADRVAVAVGRAVDKEKQGRRSEQRRSND